MKFGSVTNVEGIDFSLPIDHVNNIMILGGVPSDNFEVSVGCAKWNKQDLKNFYPKGVKEELVYYASQFNSIELNATFYQAYGREQFEKWYSKTPPKFKFFPKIPQTISHLRRLNEVQNLTEEFCLSVSGLEEKLGMIFLQMHDNFKPKDFDRLARFVENFPKGYPLAIELRNSEWFQSEQTANEVADLFQQHHITNVLVDTAGRRDLLHMRLTTPVAFVRYVGANHATDFTRLDPWINRIEEWKKQGLKALYFFIHQNLEEASPLISAAFIKQLNERLALDLHVPVLPSDGTLF